MDNLNNEKKDAVHMHDIMALIPEEERAVEEDILCEPKEVALEYIDPYANVLSTEELAVEPIEKSGALEKADKKGFFSPVIGMARLSNILGGKYFAQVCIDEEGCRRIEICQEYESGGYSPKIKIKQSDFVRAAGYQFNGANISNRKMKNAVESFLMRLSSECLDKFDGIMSFDIVKILKTLGTCYRNLPIHNDFNEDYSPAEFYQKIMEVLEQCYVLEDDSFCGHKAYFPLDGGDIKYIAEQLDMTKGEFLKKLKAYHFLYLTDSSVAYQTNVRITVEEETYTAHKYCILRLQYLADQ